MVCKESIGPVRKMTTAFYGIAHAGRQRPRSRDGFPGLCRRAGLERLAATPLYVTGACSPHPVPVNMRL